MIDLNNKTILTMEELAEYSGLEKSYLYKLTAKGIIPHYKPFGKKVYFKRTEVEEFLTTNH